MLIQPPFFLLLAIPWLLVVQMYVWTAALEDRGWWPPAALARVLAIGQVVVTLVGSLVFVVAWLREVARLILGQSTVAV
jgi:hypothetical protein